METTIFGKCIKSVNHDVILEYLECKQNIYLFYIERCAYSNS